MPSLPLKNPPFGAVGAHFPTTDRTVFCGGRDNADCYEYDRMLRQWVVTEEFAGVGQYAAAAMVDADRLWITGGRIEVRTQFLSKFYVGAFRPSFLGKVRVLLRTYSRKIYSNIMETYFGQFRRLAYIWKYEKKQEEKAS